MSVVHAMKTRQELGFSELTVTDVRERLASGRGADADADGDGEADSLALRLLDRLRGARSPTH